MSETARELRTKASRAVTGDIEYLMSFHETPCSPTLCQPVYMLEDVMLLTIPAEAD